MQALGIQIDRPFVRAALLQKGRSGIKLCALKSALIAEPEDVKQLYTPAFKGRLASGLSSQDLLIRPMELKMAQSRYIEEALAFQSESMTHLNPADILAVPHAIKKGKGKVEAHLCTASRAALQLHLQELKTLQADPDCVSSNCLALIQYIRWKAPSLSDAFLIDLGSSEWTCVWMEKRELKKSHSLTGGIEALLSAFWEDRKKILLPKEVEGAARQIDLLQLKPNFNPHLSAKLNALRQELAKTICSFYRISTQKPIVFTGRIDAFGHLREFLTEAFKEAISNESDPLPRDIEQHKFAISIGLALEQMDRPLQLLQQEFFPRKNWRRAGLYALILCCLSTFLSGCFLLSGLKAIEGRKKEMLESVRLMLDQWDSKLKESIFSDESSSLDRWMAAVAAHGKEYPYILQAPRVAEALAWLSNHPLLAEFKKDGEPLEVRSFRYQLLEYPKIGATRERYQAKVDLEFHVKSPMNARKFHEALLAGDAMIDRTSEVGWEASGDGYRASFFLSNHRSPYVP